MSRRRRERAKQPDLRRSRRMALRNAKRPAGQAGERDDLDTRALEAGDSGLELARLTGVGDGDDGVAGLGLAGRAVHALGAVELVGRRAGGREQRRGVARDVARLADARHVETAAGGLGLLDEMLGGSNGVVVDALDEGLDLLLHDAEELVDLLLEVCHALPFSWMGLWMAARRHKTIPATAAPPGEARPKRSRARASRTSGCDESSGRKRDATHCRRRSSAWRRGSRRRRPRRPATPTA